MRASLPSFALAALLSLGCAPDIGDSCETSVDCSQTADRLCDVSQAAHGGYCTVFDCEPGECPEDSACVLFGASPSPSSECENTSGTNPSARSFCMKRCDNLSDCRHKDGYTCMVPLSPAENLDGGKVCMLPQSGIQVPADRPGGVCMGMNPPSGGAGAGGAGGTGGAGGMGGDGGQGGEGGAG